MSNVSLSNQESRSRVALILPNLGGGGAERVALVLADHFLKIGHEVDVVLLGSGGELSSLVPSGARLIELGAERFRAALLPLVRYFRLAIPDATQAFMWPVTVLTVIAHRLAGRPGRLALSDHATLSKQYAPRLRALRATTRIFYPAAQARICVSADVADDLACLSGIDRGGIHVIKNPVKLPEQYPNRVPAVEELWPAGGRRILTVGSFKREKNQKLLLDSFAILSARQRVVLMMLGDGPMRDELEAHARQLNVADRVAMPGVRADPAPYYASADMFVLSSDDEGYPLVLVEALGAGLPTISTACGSGAQEILGNYGRLTPVADAIALADAMEATLHEHPAQDVLRSRAAKLVEGSCAAHQMIMFGNDRP
jgi:glycosyltransferase involved in cell wall biosynthesis